MLVAISILFQIKNLLKSFGGGDGSVAKSSLTLSTPEDHQTPLSMGFPRQEYWSGLPFPSPGDLPNPRIKLMSAVLAD